jgi:hypothetical protein
VIQLLPYMADLVGWVAATHSYSVASAPGYNTFGHRNLHAIPMPWPVTFRNLVIISRDPGHNTTLALMKEGVATALEVSLTSASDGPIKNTSDEVSVAALEDVHWQFSDNDGSGYTYGFCVEAESQGNIFGVPGAFGAAPVGARGVAGALGNGFWQSYTTSYSTSRSICALAGRLTHLAAKTYATTPGPGEGWMAVIRLNLVEQDGTGGTVDTRCFIVGDGVTTSALATFSLPLVPGDIVEVVYYRTGTDLPFEVNGNVAIGVGFVPTIDGRYMLTGGSNQSLDGYTWILAGFTDQEPLCLAPVGPGGLRVIGAYISGSTPGVNPTDEVTWTLRRSEADTDVAIALQHLTTDGLITGLSVSFAEDDTIGWKSVATSGNPNMGRLYWGLAVGPDEEGGGSPTTGVIGPLAWVHWPRRINTASPATVTTDTYSDMDMQCPADWENGFKEGLVTQWGEAERPSSHLFSGEWEGTTFQFQIADPQGRFRTQLASTVDRYWSEALTVRMTTRANRAALGSPYTVFSGPIIDAQPVPSMLWDITLGDVVSHSLLSDRAQVPWRQIRDGFLSELSEISENLDRDAPEPIIYGIFDRVPNETTSPGTATGVRLKPIYLGITEVNSDDYHVWLVCGHAVQNLHLFVDGNLELEAPVFNPWLIPHQSDFNSTFGGPYADKVSDTYGDTRRYTLIFGRVGSSEPDDCADGTSEMTVAVWGIEEEGDGSGDLITDRFQQYKHFLINYVANSGPQSYQSGAWLDNPTWDIFDGPIEKVDEESFNIATEYAMTRLSGGYVGAAAIGIRSGDRLSAKTWIATWNRSCACRFGITHEGQMRIFLLAPTQALKDAAVLYTDAYEILEDTFATEVRWDDHATSIPFQTDFDPVSGQYTTNGVVKDDEAIANYGRDIPSEMRQYDFAPGMEQAEHLATLENRIRKHPPRYVRLDGTIGHDPITLDSLGYRDIGDYIRYVSFDAVMDDGSSPTSGRQIRLAQVITPIVRVGTRHVGVVAMDCEDLIDYDEGSSESGITWDAIDVTWSGNVTTWT